MGQHYMGHNYAGHKCMGHNYAGHKCMGDNLCQRKEAEAGDATEKHALDIEGTEPTYRSGAIG